MLLVSESTFSSPNYASEDVNMEKVAYDPDFFTRVKDIFQKRKKREMDIYDANEGEMVSIFNYIKDSSTAGKCEAPGSQPENEVSKKRRKRNIPTASRIHLTSDYVRDKRRAEQELLELQHKYVRCNNNAGTAHAEECQQIYLNFQRLLKEVNEKFHQFSRDNFEGHNVERKPTDTANHLNGVKAHDKVNQVPDLQKNVEVKPAKPLHQVPHPQKKDEKVEAKNAKPMVYHVPHPEKKEEKVEVKPAKKANQVPNLQKNMENVGQTFFGDGFYSYTYDQIPKFHEDLHRSFDSPQRNFNSMSRDQGRLETIQREDQTKNIPVKVPEPTGEIYVTDSM